MVIQPGNSQNMVVSTFMVDSTIQNMIQADMVIPSHREFLNSWWIPYGGSPMVDPHGQNPKITVNDLDDDWGTMDWVSLHMTWIFGIILVFKKARTILQIPFLVGGLEHDVYCSSQLGISSSQLTNSIIFQRGRLAPTNQLW